MTISRRLRLGLPGFVVAAVIATPGLAGGNSDYASRCIDWQALYRTDGTPFDNQGACVSYAAHGGTPTAAFLHLDQAPCPATGFLSGFAVCFWISGAGLKANASYDDFFAAAVALSGGGAADLPPMTDANGAIATRVVLGGSSCGGYMEWRATYTTAQNTPITASVHFDFPACPFPAAQALCLGYGGTFGHDDQLAGGTRSYLWTCNNLPADFPFPSGNDALAQRCFADGGTLFVYNPAPGASTCFND